MAPKFLFVIQNLPGKALIHQFAILHIKLELDPQRYLHPLKTEIENVVIFFSIIQTIFQGFPRSQAGLSIAVPSSKSKRPNA